MRRFAALALLPLVLVAPLRAQEAPPPARPRPTWGEAAVVSGVALGASVLGGLVGMTVGQGMSTPPPSGCKPLCTEGVAGLAAGMVLGAAGAGAAGRAVLGRGSALGLVLGAGLGLGIGAGVDSGGAAALLVPVGAAAGFRYGPGARGPRRSARMAVVPVATPGAAGVYAAVSF